MKRGGTLSFYVIMYLPLGLELCIKDAGYHDVSTEFLNCDLVMTKGAYLLGQHKQELPH